MNAHALLADGVQESGQVAGQDLRNVGVAQLRVQAADHGGQFFRSAAAAVALDRFDGVSNAVYRVADGVRKIAIELEKFKNAAGRQIGCVYLAVGLE